MRIQLTRGVTTVIDDCDADLAGLKWHAGVHDKRADGQKYAAKHSLPAGKTLWMHLVIMERILGRKLKKREVVNHKDGDLLNNQRDNLRIATPSQSQVSLSPIKSNTSGYRGVHFNKGVGMWQSRIKKNGVRYHLGYFNTPEDAYAEYCRAAKELHGEFAQPA